MPYMVVVAAAGRERDCRALVRDYGFACYQPTYRELLVRRRRKVWEERLLFGRYFFAKWFEGCNWRVLLAHQHAVSTERKTLAGLFMWSTPDGAEPAKVKDQVITDIRSREDRSGHVDTAARNGFSLNQPVRAITGVFAGKEGRYTGSRSNADVALMDLFGRETRIEFAPGALVAVETTFQGTR